MRTKKDLAETLPNPHMLGCIYFTLLAILATIVLKEIYCRGICRYLFT